MKDRHIEVPNLHVLPTVINIFRPGSCILVQFNPANKLAKANATHIID